MIDPPRKDTMLVTGASEIVGRNFIKKKLEILLVASDNGWFEI